MSNARADTTQGPERASILWHGLLPAGMLGAATALIWLGDLDMGVARHLYDPSVPGGWPVGDLTPLAVLYRWGELPAVVLGAVGLILLGLATGRSDRAGQRRAGALLVLAMLVGPLLVTNVALKGFYGRPRPRQVEALGGERPFRPVLLPTFRRDESGFPSGHASAAFAPLALYFALRPRRARLAWLAVGGSLAWGGAVGFARIAQGGHFVSDVLWAAGVDYYSAYGVDWWLARRRASASVSDPAMGSRWRGRLAFALAGLICAVYLLRLPLSEVLTWEVPLQAGIARARLEFGAENGGITWSQAPVRSDLLIHTRVTGRGPPGTKVTDHRMIAPAADGQLLIRYRLATRGPLATYRTSTTVLVPDWMTIVVSGH